MSPVDSSSQNKTKLQAKGHLKGVRWTLAIVACPAMVWTLTASVPAGGASTAAVSSANIETKLDGPSHPAQPNPAPAGQPAEPAAPAPAAPQQTLPGGSPATVPQPPGPATRSAAQGAIAAFVDRSTGIGKAAAAEPGKSTASFAEIAKGAALGELEAQEQEFSSNHWRQSGTVKTVGEPVLVEEIRDGHTLIHATVCVDSSNVQTTDESGAVVLAASPEGTRKYLNTYVLQEIDGKWLIVEHTFPNDPAC